METAKLQIHIIHVEKSFDERFIVSTFDYIHRATDNSTDLK